MTQHPPGYHSEEACLKALQQGQEWALNYLFNQWFRKLCVYAYHFVKEEAAAEDIVQEAWIQLLKELPRIHNSDIIRPYLLKIIRWRSFNFLRDRNTRRRREDLFLGAIPDRVTEHEHALIAAELFCLLSTRSALLPDRRREIFQLHYIADLSNREIADRLNISEVTVRVQKAKAIAWLKKTLKSGLLISFFLLYL